MRLLKQIFCTLLVLALCLSACSFALADTYTVTFGDHYSISNVPDNWKYREQETEDDGTVRYYYYPYSIDRGFLVISVYPLSTATHAALEASFNDQLEEYRGKGYKCDFRKTEINDISPVYYWTDNSILNYGVRITCHRYIFRDNEHWYSVDFYFGGIPEDTVPSIINTLKSDLTGA